MSLITPDMSAAIWSILFIAAAIGFWIDGSNLGKYFSGAAAAVLITLILANVNILPNAAKPYDVVWSTFVPVAIPLLLYKANLRAILKESGIVMGAFVIGAVGVLIGTFVGYFIIPLGELGPELAGLLSATYIGGSMNFAAVAQALEITDDNFLTAAVAADNVAGIGFLAILASLPALAWARNALPERHDEAHNDHEADERREIPRINLLYLTLGVGLSFAIVAISVELAKFIGTPSYSVLFITAITVTLATTIPQVIGKLDGDYEIGIALMYVFFATIGAGADINALLKSFPIFMFAALIILFHIAILFAASKLLKITLAELVVASCACILGPTVAAAIAGARGWNKLITPGILTGVFGYVIASYLGVAIATGLK